MFKQANVEFAIDKLMDEINDCEEMLEYDRESIDVESCEKHLDFCKEILETIKGE
jgi:hypothetical protein